uniref:Uncharacterized protein n=1 Tax=Oryza punctata TaxID=4537 RepID=A0A0E0JHE6_ORYPU
MPFLSSLLYFPPVAWPVDPSVWRSETGGFGRCDGDAAPSRSSSHTRSRSRHATRCDDGGDSVFRTPPIVGYCLNGKQRVTRRTGRQIHRRGGRGMLDLAASDLHGDVLTATAGCRCDKCPSSPLSSTSPRWLGQWIHRCGGRRRADLEGAMVTPPPLVLPPTPEAGAVTGNDNKLLL